MSFETPDEATTIEPELTPDQRITTLKEENNALRQRNEALGADNEDLKAENEQLKEREEEKDKKIKELEEKAEALEKLAFMDALTETFNRRGLERMVKVLLPPDLQEGSEKRDHSIENRIPVTVTIVDLDNFKKFNDTHGHAEGDEVLRQAANVLKRFLRGNDIVARYGGEEFLVIHSNTTPEDIKQRILDENTGHLKINFTAEVKGERIPISFSGGMTAVRPDETVKDFETIIKRADSALYKSKELGKDRITHDEENPRKEEPTGENL